MDCAKKKKLLFMKLRPKNQYFNLLEICKTMLLKNGRLQLYSVIKFMAFKYKIGINRNIFCEQEHVKTFKIKNGYWNGNIYLSKILCSLYHFFEGVWFRFNGWGKIRLIVKWRRKLHSDHCGKACLQDWMELALPLIMIVKVNSQNLKVNEKNICNIWCI